ncbi:ATP-grasp domain-containing protein [Ideonella sp. A 288]|uniref:ATP-grasp domain-containing protein n=1 Tax=Ideonella sp. A 288 TaxID=1962181 RepID=UPI000B4AB98E|nr:ATP-grasp domain-containing protein [Ideonella sp. A 288]
MAVLVVAAVSARVLAEQARDDGFEVVALDLFGDVDTRSSCAQWLPIGRPGSLHIDADATLAALDSLARAGGAIGWIAGSGFEGQPELLQRGDAVLPLIGTAPEAVRRVRDPRQFFGMLDAEGIGHPEVSWSAPADGQGWLIKDAAGCGGWHIRRAAAAGEASAPVAPDKGHYLQREMPGRSMSATFIANGTDACVLGFNELIVQRMGDRPHVYGGVVGPVPLPDGVAHRIEQAVRRIASVFGLRGLGSLDFLLDGDDFAVLEVNPRPPASMDLYGRQQGTPSPGPIAAHLRACLHDELPVAPSQGPRGIVKGTQIVFAPAALQLDAAAAHRLAHLPGCHDLPSAHARFDSHDPLCSVSASGPSAEAVRASLERGREAALACLETLR